MARIKSIEQFKSEIYEDSKSQMEKVFAFGSKINSAHIIMLYEVGLLSEEALKKILSYSKTLEEESFDSLLAHVRKRGWYVALESHLIAELGERVAGSIHLGRSRNDIDATLFRLQLRKPFQDLCESLIYLNKNLLVMSKKYYSTPFPLFTQMQPACTSTFGHYLCGIAQVFWRDFSSFLQSIHDVNNCPLGAAAAGGTSVPINNSRTAQLLGFNNSKINSIDAVAGYDFGLRLAGCASICAVNVSRVCQDLHLWSTKELNLASFDETITGGSSVLPQKRNVYLIEHVKAKASKASVKFNEAMVGMFGTPFTNGIEEKQAVSGIASLLEEITDVIGALTLIIMKTEPLRDIKTRSIYEDVTAQIKAEKISITQDIPFRVAHNIVSEQIKSKSRNNSQYTIGKARDDISTNEELWPLADFGGGPGPKNLLESITISEKNLKELIEDFNVIIAGWDAGDELLRGEINKYTK